MAPVVLRRCLILISILAAIILIPLIFFLIRTSRAATSRESVEEIIKNIAISLTFNPSTGHTAVVCSGSQEIISLAVGQCGADSQEFCENHVNCLLRKYKLKGRREMESREMSLVKCGDHNKHHSNKTESCRVGLRFQHGAIVCETRGGGKIIDFFTTIPPSTYILASAANEHSSLIEIRICRQIWFKNESLQSCLTTTTDDDDYSVKGRGKKKSQFLTPPPLKLISNAPTGRIQLRAHPLFFKDIQIFIVIQNGVKIDVGDDWAIGQTSWGGGDQWESPTLWNFVALKNVTGITCVAQFYRKNKQHGATDMTRWIEQTLHFNVVDPIVSMETTTGSVTSVPLTGLNSSIGCSFFGNLEKLNHWGGNKIFSSNVTKGWSKKENLVGNLKIISMEEFLTFLTIVSDQDYVCKFLPKNNFDEAGDFVVNLGDMGAPVLRNNASIKNEIDDRAETTLTCGYSGDPQPIVLWIQNGVKLMYSKGLPYDGPSDIFIGKNRLVVSSLKFILPHSPVCGHHLGEPDTMTCVAINIFGMTSRHFVIPPTKYCDHQDVQLSQKTAVVLNTLKFNPETSKLYSNDTCQLVSPNYPTILEEGAVSKELTRNPLTALVGFLTLILLIVRGPWLYGKIYRKCGCKRSPPPDSDSSIAAPPQDPSQSSGGGGSASAPSILVGGIQQPTEVSPSLVEVAESTEMTTDESAIYLNDDDGARPGVNDTILSMAVIGPQLDTTGHDERQRLDSPPPTYDEFAPPSYIELV